VHQLMSAKCQKQTHAPHQKITSSSAAERGLNANLPLHARKVPSAGPTRKERPAYCRAVWDLFNNIGHNRPLAIYRAHLFYYAARDQDG
jgi:hypothetical protein